MLGLMYYYLKDKNGNLIRFTPHGSYMLVKNEDGTASWIKR